MGINYLSSENQFDYPPPEYLELLEAVVRPLDQAVTISNQNGFILVANPKVADVYGWPLREVIGSHWTKFCSSPLKEAWEQIASQITTALANGQEWQGALREQKKNSSEVIVMMRVILLTRWSMVINYAHPLPIEAANLLKPRTTQRRQNAEGMTDTQKKVPYHLGHGMKVEEIAEKMGTSSQSVRTLISRVCQVAFAGEQTETNIKKLTYLAIQCVRVGWTPKVELIGP